MSNFIARVRIEKEQHPERFCADKKCLWRVVGASGKPCRTHTDSCEVCGVLKRRGFSCPVCTEEERANATHER